MHLKMKVEFDPTIQAFESQFVELIRRRLGIVMHVHQHYELYKTIQEACTKFSLTPAEYLSQLADCPTQSPLLHFLVAGITVGETYFFRDQQQMQLLQHYILPDIIKKKRETNSLSIRIWSAGCATGEEIYSIAMMLSEILPDIGNWTIKLLATDVNTTVLQKAIKGTYTEWSMRSISDYFKQKYFQKETRYYQIAQTIKEMVNFDYLNLNDDNYPSIFNGTNAQDLIICRNVLIYIDNETCHRIMLGLNKSLVQEGYLMLGASDPINIAKTDFVFHAQRGSLFTRRLTEKLQPVITTTKTIINPATKIIKITKKIEPKIKKLEKIKKIEKIETIKQDLVTRATDLANMGKLNEAIKLCEEGFRLEPTNKLNYFTYGLTLSELNRLPEAESALRKTLFLDNQFVAGHFQLGLLLLRKNQHEAGLKSLKNALAIAESKQQQEVVPGSQGLCYKDFADILRNEINLHITIGS